MSTNATSISLSEKCYNENQLVLMSDLEKNINRVIFPFQFFITVFGNLLTMSVLVSRHMKNRANHLLAFLALCDILVFIMMLPHYLSSTDTLSSNVSFRYFLFTTKVHFAAFTNWFSAAAIWFVLAISLERLLVIKYPFRSLDDYNIKQILLIAGAIFIGTCILTSYHHVSHTCFNYLVCSGQQLIGLCFSNMMDSFGKKPNPTSPFTKKWIALSVYSNAIFAVLFPICAVALLNVSLIRLVKQRNSQDLLVQRSASTVGCARQEQERKMTHTVLAIVSCFSLTQGPSAVVFCLLHILPNLPFLRETSVIANQLVLTGKMLNVVLFCLTSQTFRRKMFHTCNSWVYVIFCGGKLESSRINREKSFLTQKTSLVYSPSTRNTRRISDADSIAMKSLTPPESAPVDC